MYFIVVIYKRKMEILLEWNFSKYFIGIRNCETEKGKEFFKFVEKLFKVFNSNS